MATIKDVAREAGVSIATVSRVINKGPKVGDKTRQKVFEVMQKIGYSPNANARALVTQRSATIGLVIPDVADPFFASLANAVEQVARDKQKQLLISTGQHSAESEKQAINLLKEQRCDCFILHSKEMSNEALLELAQETPNLVLINRYIPAIKDRCIWLDNIEGGKIAARHYASLGHSDIAVINSDFNIEDPALRYEGFKQTLLDKAININDNLVVNAEPTLAGGEAAAQQLLARDEVFSAIFAYNDAMAIGAISVLEDNGLRVPADVSVIGFDDVLLSRYSRPKLTTLRYPIHDMAVHAAELAIANADGDSLPNTKGLQYIPSLIKRESTKAAELSQVKD